MKSLEIYIEEENTTHTLNPFVAEFNVRGVVTFNTEFEAEDLNGIFDLMYGLVGEEKVDEHGRSCKQSEVELLIPGPEGLDWQDGKTRLAIGYSAELEGETAIAFLVISEEQMIETWREAGATLMQKLHEFGELAEAGDASAKDTWQMLHMIIEGLKYVSGEQADFTTAFHEWAASKNRNACARLQLAEALPMAA